MLCIRDGERKSTPIGRGRGFRFGFENDDFYFKSQDEMKEAFLDLPESIETIQEIIDKCEPNTKKSGGGKACIHGNRYEDVSILLYQKKKTL